jgi:hypothetical protein
VIANVTPGDWMFTNNQRQAEARAGELVERRRCRGARDRAFADVGGEVVELSVGCG